MSSGRVSRRASRRVSRREVTPFENFANATSERGDSSRRKSSNEVDFPETNRRSVEEIVYDLEQEGEQETEAEETPFKPVYPHRNSNLKSLGVVSFATYVLVFFDVLFFGGILDGTTVNWPVLVLIYVLVTILSMMAVLETIDGSFFRAKKVYSKEAAEELINGFPINLNKPIISGFYCACAKNQGVVVHMATKGSYFDMSPRFRIVSEGLAGKSRRYVELIPKQHFQILTAEARELVHNLRDQALEGHANRCRYSFRLTPPERKLPKSILVDMKSDLEPYWGFRFFLLLSCLFGASPLVYWIFHVLQVSEVLVLYDVVYSLHPRQDAIKVHRWLALADDPDYIELL